MLKLLILFAFLVSSSAFLTHVFATEIEIQKESERIIDELGWDTPDKTDLQEQFQIIIDQTSRKNKISIGLLSTNPNDILYPDNIEAIVDDPRIVSFQLTNQFACAPTKIDRGCIIIEVMREGLGTNFTEIKKNAREITDKIIEPGIIVFAPEFYSVGVETITSYDGKKKITVARAIYTTPKENGDTLFRALTPMLIGHNLINGGGFYDYGKKLASNPLSEFTITLIPLDDKRLRTVYLSQVCSNIVPELPRCDLDGTIDKKIGEGIISPADFLQLENINRSKIFEGEFLPLNSIIQVLILSDDNLYVKDVNSNVIDRLDNIGDVQDSGWFFLSDSGQKIDARYLFGKQSSVNKNDLVFTIDYSNNEKIMDKTDNGGGCLIATAAFGSELSPQVQLLREIRDGKVMTTQSGSVFMNGFNQFYYSFSPAIADYQRENPAFKEIVKSTLTPLLTSLTLLNYVDIDSEHEILGYGIGMILLNIGIYFIAPVVIITRIKKLF